MLQSTSGVMDVAEPDFTSAVLLGALSRLPQREQDLVEAAVHSVAGKAGLPYAAALELVAALGGLLRENGHTGG